MSIYKHGTSGDGSAAEAFHTHTWSIGVTVTSSLLAREAISLEKFGDSRSPNRSGKCELEDRVQTGEVNSSVISSKEIVSSEAGKHCDAQVGENFGTEESKSDVTRHTCSLCEKILTRKCILLHDMRTMHTPANLSHSCTLCGKRFKHHSKLTEHAKTHSKVRPHRCPVCDKAFTARTSMKVHLTNKHADMDKCLLYCQHKRLEYKRGVFETPLFTVTTHEQSRHLCTVSKEDFTRKRSHPTRVNDKYVNDVPALCDICGNWFRNKWALKAHTRLHMPTYRCQTCGRVPTFKCNLATRIRAVHHEAAGKELSEKMKSVIATTTETSPYRCNTIS